MGKNTGIAWCDHTFSPWWGCTKVSPACDHCYAEAVDARFSAGDQHWGPDARRRFFGEKHWNEPLAWNRAAAAAGTNPLVFCASMADVLERHGVVQKGVGSPSDVNRLIVVDDLEPWRLKLWGTIKATQHMRWLILTKRPQNIGRMVPPELRGARNIWWGTTIESPAYLWRADALIDNAGEAPVRFVSMEPLLEQTALRGRLDEGGINWVITGCESGDGARDTPTDWYRSLRDEARAAGRPFLLKQAPRGADGIAVGDGSWVKRDLRKGADGIRRNHPLVELPYLDGVQHAARPTP